MSKFFKRYKTLIITLSVLSIVILFFIYSLLKVTPKLPIIQPDMVDRSLVDSTLHYKKKYHTISPFTLINQNGDTITQEDYSGKIYVADFFFTTCQSICPIMTEHMVEIQKELGTDTLVKLLSHSVIPTHDTPEVLKKYAKKNGVDDSRWNLVTGSQKDIFTLARKSYLAVQDIPGTEDDLDMVHTENFMLIDKKGQIRGHYDGTDDTAIQQLLKDIEILKEEYKPKKSWWEKLL